MSWLVGYTPLLSLLLYIANAEWVEIPQFSDQRKVYRTPTLRPYRPTPQSNGDRRIYTDANDRYGHRIDLQWEENTRNVSRFSGHRQSIYENGEPPFAGTIATFTTERIFSSDPDEGIVVESIEDEETQFDEIPILYSSSEDHTTNFNSDTAVAVTTASSTRSHRRPIPEIPTKPPINCNKTEDDKGFFDYLPVDLLKRVHATLKSQPPTLKGKIRFLKAFERTLLQEIENRLSVALAPTRTTRRARGHEYQDDAIGFPSLEGALMAISFLTFAVYLVRLVMLLFRNATLNGATPPIFVGRKKRSIDQYTEQAARILSYLDSSSEQYYKSQKQLSRMKKHFDSTNLRNDYVY